MPLAADDDSDGGKPSPMEEDSEDEAPCPMKEDSDDDCDDLCSPMQEDDDIDDDTPPQDDDSYEPTRRNRLLPRSKFLLHDSDDEDEETVNMVDMVAVQLGFTDEAEDGYEDSDEEGSMEGCHLNLGEGLGSWEMED